MTDEKFQQSCLRFKKAMERENNKRRKLIKIEGPLSTKVKITAVESNFPKLDIQDLIKPRTPKSDVLQRLVGELGIDKDDDNIVQTSLPYNFNCDGENKYGETLSPDYDFIPWVLSSIRPIHPTKKARFQINTQHGVTTVYIRSSLDVWVIYGNEKFVYPKPRTDVAMDS
ncbi:hypothetical protein FF38_02215 [Lucilia cuprina]|uniref:Uncharacterized protein n=1 Tax=Lucilia cuprina TaxID=7375 RepID=A0A0L0BZC5_LUCCU|nr:hypothetical protein FF38_02215 [Lucilia cuprina]